LEEIIPFIKEIKMSLKPILIFPKSQDKKPMVKKTMYPHIYEYQKLGMFTPDGKKYYEVHEKELDIEYREAIEFQLSRQRLGTKNIHLIDERGDI
jgi:hypothetical protein